jgi:hypothetical protein
MLLLSLLWIAFGLTAGVGAHPSYQDAGVVRWAMTAVGIVTAGILAILASQLRRRNRLSYWLSVAVLAALTLVGLLDQLGLADLIFLLITVLPLALLIKDRTWYLKTPLAAGQDQRAA